MVCVHTLFHTRSCNSCDMLPKIQNQFRPSAMLLFCSPQKDILTTSTSLCSRYSDWLRAGRPRGQSSESRLGQEFSFLHIVQTDSGAHPASYTMGTGGSFPEGKTARA
jgi:hypothetical protein